MSTAESQTMHLPAYKAGGFKSTTRMHPMGGARYILLEYIERDVSKIISNSNVGIIYMSEHHSTDLTACTMTCRFSVARIADDPSGRGIYPRFFGTYKYKDGVEYDQYINYLGGVLTDSSNNFIFCQRQGDILSTTSQQEVPLNNEIMEASIVDKTATIHTGNGTFSIVNRPEKEKGDFGYPCVFSYRGWNIRYYHYTYDDGAYRIDAVPAYDCATGMYGMYDTVHRAFYGSIYWIGARRR